MSNEYYDRQRGVFIDPDFMLLALGNLVYRLERVCCQPYSMQNITQKQQ